MDPPQKRWSVTAFFHIEFRGLLAVAYLWIELAIAAALLTGFLAATASAIALLLLLIFSVAQGTLLLRGQEVPCGCFGSLSEKPVSWRNVLINLGFGACCLQAAWVVRGNLTLHWLSSSFCFQQGLFHSPAEPVLLQLFTAGLLIQFMILKQAITNRYLGIAYDRYLREVAAAGAIQSLRPNQIRE
jgi:Methylamine utilisation protein MauE